MKIGQSLICTKRVFFTFPNNASLLRKYHNCSSPKEYNTNNSVRKIPKRNPEQIRIQMMRGRRRPPGKGRLIWMQCTITLHTRHLPFLSTFSDFFPSTMNLILFDKSRWAYLGPHWTYGDLLALLFLPLDCWYHALPSPGYEPKCCSFGHLNPDP